ncbi:hypothetical protein N7509_005554 [Penicillium cosmopolitanum]|uniref:Uncharacterized protein n=1 Tax=Penicillium cosmopolitanum TaxID=1131564 RepID=A0A9X0BA52_9EURO|nr:uncharacterized protein N7509_005554 [Penicillium cosmopolitanum]KAJ5397441.1 hypothetical protein N7509_005554 [Penicillium cosmopolitanum]
MAPLRNTLICLMAASSVYAEHLRVVWSSGSFSSISGPSGGNQNGGYSGFAILNDAGDAVYDQPYPDDHSPCYLGSGREFTIEGQPQSCAVKDGDGNVLGSADAQKDTTFIGIAIGIDASCVIEFDSDSDGCPIDDGNGPLHVTSG